MGWRNPWQGKVDTESTAHAKAGKPGSSCSGETQPKAQGTLHTTHMKKSTTYPLKNADSPSWWSIVIAQLGTLVYCPGGELINLVFTTSAGEDRSVVQNPATKADSRWQGTSSRMCQWDRSAPDSL